MKFEVTYKNGDVKTIDKKAPIYRHVVLASKGNESALIGNTVVPNIIVDDDHVPTSTVTKLNRKGDMILQMVPSYTVTNRGKTSLVTKDDRERYNKIRSWIRNKAIREDDRWVSKNYITSFREIKKERKVVTAFDGKFEEFQVAGVIEGVNPIEYAQRKIDVVVEYIKSRMKKMTGIKFQYRMDIKMSNIKGDIIDPRFYSPLIQCLNSSDNDLAEKCTDCITHISSTIDKFTDKGSGWNVDGIINDSILSAEFSPLSGSSYIPLPKFFESKKAIINIKNEDNRCFYWAIASALDPAKHHLNKVSSYKKHDLIDHTSVTYPMPICSKAYLKFEKANDIAINVFTYEGETVYPLYNSSLKKTPINLFVIKNDDNCHYARITNFNRLMFGVTKHKSQKYFCYRCLQHFTTNAILKKHDEVCSTIKMQKVHMPENNDLCFKEVKNMLKVPFVIYGDFECVLPSAKKDDAATEKELGERRNKARDSDSVQHESKHVPCGFCIKMVSIDEKLNSPIIQYRGEDVMEKFWEALEIVYDKIENILKYPKPMVMTKNDELHHANASLCYICNKNFSSCDVKVRDHCHITGKYRGTAHRSCNLNLSIQKNMKIPVIFHNLRGYDSHLIIKAFKKKDAKIWCIPNNTEKYLSFSIDNFRFIDSAQFLLSSLEGLVANLKKKDVANFKLTGEVFGGRLDMMTRKGVYPYSYMDSFSRFDEGFPSIDKFYNDLTDEPCSEKDYEHALNVWKSFKFSNMGEYHDLYLKSDVLLLADVFEEFRVMAMSYYRVDPCHYFTMPGMSWNALFLNTGAKLELLTDIDMYQFFENAIRGGISMISKRHAVTNNKYMENYDSSKVSSFISYLDANNLYGWAMSQYLPTDGFRWLSNWEINKLDIMTVPDDSPVGYTLMVDIVYPPELHDLHNEYPLCPESMVVKEEMTSDLMRKIQSDLRLKEDKACKLVPNLMNKKKYTSDYRYLKFCVLKGMIITKIHNVITYNQAPWMKPYIDFNTSKRAACTADSDKNMFKLMNNAAYGKTMENIRKRMQFEIVTSKKRFKKTVSKPNAKSFIRFNETMVGVELTKTSVELNKPIYTGACVLDLSKLLMARFHYDYIKDKYGSKASLLFTDTDSLCYHIETEDFFEDCAQRPELFDKSNYPKCHPRYDNSNNSVLGLFKDEVAGSQIVEFVGLKPKMYSLKVEKLSEAPENYLGVRYTLRNNKLEECVDGQFTIKDDEKKTCKGVQRSAVRKNIKHASYKSVLENLNSQNVDMKMFRTREHDIFTVKINKVGLSSYDNKRYLIDPVNSYAYGHYKIN